MPKLVNHHYLIIRWGTWLDAAFYYDKNFEKVKEVISAFDQNDAKCSRIIQR